MATSVTSQISGVLQSLAIKSPVHAVATTNITLSGLQTVDGVVLDGSTLYRVLCTAQTNSVDNGIWDASTGSWSRAKDFDGPRDAVKGTLVIVQSSTNTLYRLTTSNPIVPGTTALTFELTGVNLTQADLTAIGMLSTGIKYDITPAETAALVTIVDYSQLPGTVLRYKRNADPGVTDMSSAFTIAASIASSTFGRAVYAPGNGGPYYCPNITLSGTLQDIMFYGDGRASTLTTDQNAPIFTVGTCDGMSWQKLGFRGTKSDNTLANQIGILFNNHGRSKVIDCEFETLAAGIWSNNATTGYPLVGGFQVPSLFSMNRIKDCYNGILTEDDGAANYGEYCRIDTNIITDCVNWGILSKAGNTAISNNTVNGNNGGVCVYSSGTTNGDHGMVVNNTMNHNLRCGLYVTNILRSLIVSGNNCWASLGDGTTNGNLGTGNKASSFGAYFELIQNCTITGNVFGRNKINVGIDGILTSIYANNVHLTDPSNTVFQLKDYTSVASNRLNAWGPNVFNGTWTGGGTDGNPNAKNAPTLINSWVDFGGAYGASAYWRDEQNTIHLTGLIKSGTSGTVAFVLPIEFRPSATLQFATVSNGVFGQVAIDTAGNVTVTGSTANLSLDGISFTSI